MLRSRRQRRAVPAEPVDPVGEHVNRRAAVAVRAACCSRSRTGTRSRCSAKFGCSAIPSRPRSEFELTARSSTAPCTVPLTTRLTWPLAFSSTSASPGPMNAIETGWRQARSRGPDPQVVVNHLGRLRLGAARAHQRQPHGEREYRPLIASHLKLLPLPLDGRQVLRGAAMPVQRRPAAASRFEHAVNSGRQANAPWRRQGPAARRKAEVEDAADVRPLLDDSDPGVEVGPAPFRAPRDRRADRCKRPPTSLRRRGQPAPRSRAAQAFGPVGRASRLSPTRPRAGRPAEAPRGSNPCIGV